MKVDIQDNSKEVMERWTEAAIRALEKCGMVAEGYAKRMTPADTGNLRNSITHEVDTEELAVYIGSNVEYAAYVELGTGQYTEGGRPTPWVYRDEEGRYHHTHGQQARPFLKPAVDGHLDTYRKIIEDELENALKGK